LYSATWILQEIFGQYIELGTQVYLVDLCDSVRESFTRSGIWELLQADTDDTHVFPTIQDCLRQIHVNGGNINEARDRARKGGRSLLSVDEAATEFTRVGQRFGP